MDKIDNKDRPAFGHGNMEQGGAEGLSKREYFAAMAMQGILSKEAFGHRLAHEQSNNGPLPHTFSANGLCHQLATASIKMADELLTQLEQQP